MKNQRDILLEFSSRFGVELSPQALECFELYSKLLRFWNEKINLTAIVEPEEIALKHFADSLSVLKTVEIPQGSKLIDVGTGAGFPGLALKIARPDLNITLLDSTRKKLSVLENISHEMGLEVELVHARAEEVNRKGSRHEAFDFSTARAVSRLENLIPWCLPFVKKGGAFIAMKGKSAAEELEGAQKKIERSGASVQKLFEYDLGEAGKRVNIVIRK